MERWREICGQQAARLKSALEVYKHAAQLAGHGTVRDWINDNDLQKLEETQKAILAKLPRLERGEFHIAVVGAEKAGKSSFINAWIDSDLLPNKQVRCTFTTTKLHSVLEEKDQKLVVRTKNQAEFEELIEELKKQAQSPEEKTRANACKDLNLIEKNRANLMQLVGRDIQPIPFGSLEEIADDLERYAADARYAHAVRQVDLYTKSLANMDGILFYDVPGIDSGLEKHTEETKRMLEDSDAVIMVKRLAEPTIKGHEEEILRYVKSGDTSVKVKDKLFFFFSRIDDQKTRVGFLKNREEVYEECKPYEIDENKIVFGAAATVLLLHGKLKDTNYIAPKPELKKHLQMLLALEDDSDETILANSGIPELKKRMESYLQNEREAILRESCDRLVEGIMESARNIRQTVKAHVPDNPRDVRFAHDERVTEELNKWFRKQWKDIRAELDGDASGSLVGESIQAMNDSYSENAKNTIDKLENYQPENMNKFFAAKRTDLGGDDFEIMNGDLRKEINEEVILKLQDLSASLSSDLYERLLGYMDFLEARFNHSIKITDMLLEAMEASPKEYYKKQLESALSALYLRYARPLARGLLQFRHGLPARLENARANAKVYFTLSEYYPDEAPDRYARLPNYIGGSQVAAGVDKLKDAALEAGKKTASKAGEKIFKKMGGAVAGAAVGGPVGAVVGAAAGEAIMDGAAAMIQGKKPGVPHYESIQDVIAELEEDRQALAAYLGGSVFACSGIQDYAESELDRIRRIFIQKEESIRSKILTAYTYKIPELLEILPPFLQNAECDTRVADLLQELTSALRNRQEG